MSQCRACGDDHDAGLASCPRLNVPVTDGPCGTRIDRYDVERLLGSGGFGVVYLARHTALAHPVALKLIRREVVTHGDVVARFVREARAAASIDSPHVVRVTDFGTSAEGAPYFVMELLAGRDLDALLRAEHALPVARAVDITLQALHGLAAAHAVGVIHRDVKPANIVLAAEQFRGADRDHVKVVDFGLSKVSLAGGAQQLTLTGAVIGTPYYMPREQFREAREVDARADIYAMGVILYQMLSGRLPYEASSFEQLLVDICTEPPRPLDSVAPNLPRALIDVVACATAVEPEARFQSARAFIEALGAASASGARLVPTSAAGAPTPLSTPTPASPAAVAALPSVARAGSTAPATRGRSYVLPAVLVFALLATLGVGGWLFVAFVLPSTSTDAASQFASPVALPTPVAPVEASTAATAVGSDPVVVMVPVQQGLGGFDVGALMGEPGTDYNDLAGMEHFGNDQAMGEVPQIGSTSAPHVVSGHLIGSARTNTAQVVAGVHAFLPRLATCRTSPPVGLSIDVTMTVVLGRTLIASLAVSPEPSNETTRCLRTALETFDLAQSLPTDTMGTAHFVIEVPAL